MTFHDTASLQLAREIAADVCETPGMRDRYLSGELDRHHGVRAAYAALQEAILNAGKWLNAQAGDADRAHNEEASYALTHAAWGILHGLHL